MSYYTQLIPDFGLSDEQLRDRYDPDGDDDASHPMFSHWEWLQAVAQRSTRSGYWAWVQHKIGQAQDELDYDNPYNQPGEDA